GLAAISSVIYFTNKNRTKENNNQNSLEEFNKSFNTYMEYARKGMLSEDIVDSFKEGLTELNSILYEGNIELDAQFRNDLKGLIKSIYKYTVDFAVANNYIIAIKETEEDELQSNLIHLEEYLNVQKEVFTSVQ